MSVVDHINQLSETKEIQDLLAEWQVSLVQLGPTPQERFRCLLTINIDQMTAYSDPEYMFRENEEMDRILSGLPFLIGIYGTLTKYAWLHEHCTDQNLKNKIKDTIDYLIQLRNRYVDNPPILLAQIPKLGDSIETKEGSSHTRIIQPNEEVPDQFILIDLGAVRQSVYDLINQYPGRVLFLEYLITNNQVDNMTASQYKNQYQHYCTQYHNPKVYTKTIEHKGTKYNFKIETFQGNFNGIETLAMAFGYSI